MTKNKQTKNSYSYYLHACFQRAYSKFLELTMNAVFNLAPSFLFVPFSLGNGRKRNSENEEGLFVDAASVPFVNGRCHFLFKKMKIATQGWTWTFHILYSLSLTTTLPQWTRQNSEKFEYIQEQTVTLALSITFNWRKFNLGFKVVLSKTIQKRIICLVI